MDTATDVDRIVPTVLEMVKNPQAAKKKAMEARERVAQYQVKTMNTLRESINS